MKTGTPIERRGPCGSVSIIPERAPATPVNGTIQGAPDQAALLVSFSRTVV